MFTAHLSITVKRLTIQAKNSFGCHFGGHTFALQNGGGRVGARLLQILSLRRGANSKRGAYLKLGANSSIYVGLL